ncbi:MAG: cytochrome C oxidase subunit IV family protein [Phycisphaerae bacterium]|jgi:cytochrome c oxidase subunit 4
MAHAAHSHDSHAGGHEEHHAHVIVPPITLKLVLGVLLGLTVLTVATAQLEVWAMNYFNILLPAWINVTGAMLIATVKAVLVMAYFMQLRYDNPMNTVVMLFTFFAVGLFLFFTSLDLFTRDRVYDYKSTVVVAGGTGERVGLPSGTPLVVGMKQKAVEKLGAERYEYVKSHLHHGKHGHGGEDTTVSSANRSRPRVGLTAPATAHGDDHGESHESKPAGGSHSGH